MDYVASMTDLIGNTPLVRLHVDREDVALFAKLELANPTGSVKDRIGLYMVDDAIRSGRLRKGGLIIEPTAGNTGLGIALAAISRGVDVTFVVPDRYSDEKQALMRALGAKIINTPREEGMMGAERKARELIERNPGAIMLGQFHNQANPRAHYETTGPEIYKALDGRIDYFVAGAGSGGTFSGVMRYLKEQIPAVKGILADPVGSTIGGGEKQPYEIEGIGNDFIPETMDMSLVDEVIKVNDAEAYKGSRAITSREGIFAGSSSGAAYAASLKLIESGVKGTIVTIFPDRGDRYFSKNLYV